MDVCVLNDQKISQKTHCRIVYEYKQNRFFLVPEAGSLTYMEGKALESERELQSGDCFRLGDSEFEFIAFCRGIENGKSRNTHFDRSSSDADRNFSGSAGILRSIGQRCAHGAGICVYAPG